MALVIMILIAIVLFATIAWALIKVVEKVYNIIVIISASRNPDVTKQKHGIVYNKKTKKLEADQSPITPF
ncbi:MAG: hypothetical protein LBD28_01005 [Tannerellaceae bacterium]|jgi:hypothetical protein|nr:hypothetical protein [Tannerellaceae bacterium]